MKKKETRTFVETIPSSEHFNPKNFPKLNTQGESISLTLNLGNKIEISNYSKEVFTYEK